MDEVFSKLAEIRKAGKERKKGKGKKEKEKQKERRGKESKIASHRAKQIVTLNKASMKILVLMLTYIFFPILLV